MDLELKKKSLKIKIHDELFENIRVPSMDEVEELERSTEGKDWKEMLSTMRSFLVNLGFQLEAIKKLDQDDFMTLVRFVSNPKKKQVT